MLEQPDRNMQVRFCLKWFWNSENVEFLELQPVLIKCSLCCAPYIGSDSVHPQFCSILVWCLLNFSFNSEPIWINYFWEVQLLFCQVCTILQVFFTLWQVIYYFFYLHSSISAAKKKQCWHYPAKLQFLMWTLWFRILLLLLLQMRIFWNKKY